MRVQIRRAQHTDAPALVAVKKQLPMPRELREGARGGFLLGTSLAEYENFIARDDVLVAQDLGAQRIVGFAIVMQHESVMHSEIWIKAQQVNWDESFRAQFSDGRVAYFEQLAFVPDDAYRTFAKYLAFASVYRVFPRHTDLFTTVVRHPIHNQASLPFITAIGFAQVGALDETYPEYGHIVSDIYHLSQSTFEATLRDPRWAAFVARARRNGFLEIE